MSKSPLYSLICLLLLSLLVLGCGSSNDKTPPSSSPQPSTEAKQQIVTMQVTVSQFIEAYNKEIGKRLSEKSKISDEAKPIRPGTVLFKVPEAKDSFVIFTFNESDSKIKDVTFTIQGNNDEKFSLKARQSWTSAIILAASPSISGQDLTDIRDKLITNTVVTKNGMQYVPQYSEKGAPFFQIIVRAK